MRSRSASSWTKKQTSEALKSLRSLDRKIDPKLKGLSDSVEVWINSITALLRAREDLQKKAINKTMRERLQAKVVASQEKAQKRWDSVLKELEELGTDIEFLQDALGN